MFEDYLTYTQEAIEQEKDIQEKYDRLKEELISEMKEKIDEETKNIESTLFKDYSPNIFHNTITTLVNKHKNLDLLREKELQNTKRELNTKLSKIIGKISSITEMYKVIGLSNQNNHYLCRVYFTLVPIEKWDCKPGDPIRVEWVQNFNHSTPRTTDRVNVSNTSQRKDKGPEGLDIPNFVGAGHITSANSFLKWETLNANQKKWWQEWVKNNRPL